MASKKLEILRQRLDLYLKAEEAILSGAQEYQIGSRSLKRGDLAEIRKMIDTLTNDIEEQEAIEAGKARRKTVGVIFRDW